MKELSNHIHESLFRGDAKSTRETYWIGTDLTNHLTIKKIEGDVVFLDPINDSTLYFTDSEMTNLINGMSMIGCKTIEPLNGDRDMNIANYDKVIDFKHLTLNTKGSMTILTKGHFLNVNISCSYFHVTNKNLLFKGCEIDCNDFMTRSIFVLPYFEKSKLRCNCVNMFIETNEINDFMVNLQRECSSSDFEKCKKIFIEKDKDYTEHIRIKTLEDAIGFDTTWKKATAKLEIFISLGKDGDGYDIFEFKYKGGCFECFSHRIIKN